MTRLICCLAVLAALVVPASADINLVTNGTFDTGCADWVGSPTPFNTPGYNQCVIPPTSSIPVLTEGNPGGFVVLNDMPAVLVSMTQAISGLTIGTTYKLTWDMASAYRNYGSSVVAGAGAEIDGNLWEFIVPNSQLWTGYSETFTYSGVSNVLTFSAQRNGTDTDAAFDNITLSAVPEPSTPLLLGLFLGVAAGLGCTLRRLRVI